jgi:transcriptional regulator with XRE-family HTH domain
MCGIGGQLPVTVGTDGLLSSDHSKRVASRLREELARRRMSRERLAAEAKISLSTLEKALTGQRPFTLATTIRLEQALGMALRPVAEPELPARKPGEADLAPEWLGSYARAAVKRLEGDYLTLRPSFQEPGSIYAYRTAVSWDADTSSLVFHESDRMDGAFTQRGQISFPSQSGHVYLVTNEEGQYRMIVLSRPTITGEMYGLLSTLKVGLGSNLTPASAPIAFIPMTKAPDAEFGHVGPGHAKFDAYRAHIDRIMGQAYAQFVVE